MNGWAGALHDDTVAVFLLHGVIHPVPHEVRNYTGKHIAAERFCEVLDALCAAGTPVSMPALVQATREGTALPPRAFIVTFDDGFENNYTVAAPMLERRGIPATFYVTSGFIEESGASWIDLIEHAFEARDEIAVKLSQGETIACRTSAEKRAALERIRSLVKADRDVDPYAFAASVRDQLGVTEAPNDPQLDAKLSWAQVRELSGHDLFTVGGHGHTHRILEFLEQPALEREVAQSLALLRSHTGAAVTHYSYPEGLAHCYSPRVIATLQRHGIECAPTAEPGVNRVGDDLFRLKRISVA